MSSIPKALLVDLGGVVVDVDRDAGRAAWAARTRRDPGDFDRIWYESGIKDALDVGVMSEVEAIPKIAALAGRAPFATAVECHCAVLKPRAAVVDLLHTVARKARIAVVSNTDPFHAGWIQRACGIDGIVESWTFSFDHRVMKPDTALLQATLDSLDLDAAEVVLLDDRADNVEAAREMGMGTVQFTRVEAVRIALNERGLL